MEPQADMRLKLLLIGDSYVGKTCLMRTYFSGCYVPIMVKTIGVDLQTKTEMLDSTRVRLQIWDTAGQERFRSIASSYFRGAHGILLVYDITDRRSFRSIHSWVKQVHENAEHGVSMMLIGNKCDLSDSRKVSIEEGAALATALNIPFLETSAKTGPVSAAFTTLAREAKTRVQAEHQGFSMEVFMGSDSGVPVSVKLTNEDHSYPHLSCMC